MENLVNLKIVQGGMLPKIKNCIELLRMELEVSLFLMVENQELY